MIELYKNRSIQHQKKMMKYLQYVINDHFLLVGLVGIGGIGYYYSEFLKTISSEMFQIPYMVLIVFILSLSVGKLSTLIQEADAVFLRPKENEMVSYLKKGYQRSLGIPLFLIVLTTAALMPLLVITSDQSFSAVLYYMVCLFALKLSDLDLKVVDLYLDTSQPLKVYRVIWICIAVLSSVLIVNGSEWIGVGLSIVYFIYQRNRRNTIMNQSQFNWTKAVQQEKQRMKRIYSFFNLFTDVPGLSGEVKRRRYLDPLLKRISYGPNQTYLYLYARVMARSAMYSRLIVRLIAVSTIVLIFSNSVWIFGIVGCLFMYLIGFQLLPLAGAFDYMVLNQLYPVSKHLKHQAILKLIHTILLFVVVLYSILSLVVLPNFSDALSVIFMYLAFFILLSKVYLSKRLKKIK